MRELVLVADLSSGALRATDGIVVANVPGIELADPASPELGQLCRLQEDLADSFSFSFSLPDGGTDVQVELAATTLASVASKIRVMANGGSPIEFLVDNPGQLATFSDPLGSLSAGLNQLTIECSLGTIGLQTAKIAFTLPFPSVSVEDGTSLSLLEPLPDTILARESVSTIRWTITDAAPEVYVTTGYRQPDGYIASLPGGVAARSSTPAGSGDQGAIAWDIPASVGAQVSLVIEAYALEPKVFGEWLTLPSPYRDCIVTDDCRYVFATRGNGASNEVDVYDTASGKLSHTLQNIAARRIAVSPNSRYLFSSTIKSDSNGTTKVLGALYDVVTRDRLKEFEFADDDPIQQALFTPDGQSLLFGTLNQGIGLLDLHSSVVTVPAPLANESTRILAISPDGRYLACELLKKDDSDLAFVDLVDDSVVWTNASFTSGIGAFSKSGDVLCVQELELQPPNLQNPFLQTVSVAKLLLLDVLSGLTLRTLTIDKMNGPAGDAGLFAVELFAVDTRLLTCEVGVSKAKVRVREVGNGNITAEYDMTVPKRHRVKVSPNSEFAVVPIGSNGSGTASAIHILALHT